MDHPENKKAPFVLYVAALLMDLGVGGTMFAITRRAAELNATTFELGLLGAMVFAAYSVFAIVGGQLSDRFGRRNLATCGCIISGVVALLSAVVIEIEPLLLLTVLLGVGIGCFWPSLIAWLGEGLSGAALAKRMSNFGIAWNIGLLTGFAMTGWLFKIQPQLAFVVPGVVFLLTTVFLYMPANPSHRAGNNAEGSVEPPVPKGRGFRKTAWLANFTVNFAQAGAFAMFPKLATSPDINIGADAHGAMLALGRGSALVMFVAMQHIGFWRTRLWPLWVVQIACVLAVAAIGWAQLAWQFAVLFAVSGLVSGVTYQASVYFTMEEMSEKGKGGGFHEAVVGSGMFLGPIFAGIAGKQAAAQGFSELRTPYFFCAGVMLLLIGLQLLVVWLRRHRVS